MDAALKEGPMSEDLTRAVIFRRGARTTLAICLIALLSAPAWAQRGRMGGPPMSMPQPMSPPPMQMPRTAPPMRPAPMPRPAPPMRMPRNMPRNGPFFRPPQPMTHSRPPERMPSSMRWPMNRPQTASSGANRGKFGISGNSTRPSPAYIPTTRTMMQRPVFTPLTSNSFRGRISLIQAFQNRVAQPAYIPPYGMGYGFGFNPFFPGFYPFVPGVSIFFGNPFFFETDCLGFSPFGSLTFDPYSAEFAYPPFANPFCGAFFSPAFYFSDLFDPLASVQTFCPLCNVQAFDPFALGLDSGFLDSFSLSTPPAAADSNAAFSGLIATPPTRYSPGATQEGGVLANEGFSGAASPASTSARSDSAFATTELSPGQPVTLVFTNGSTAQAVQYWLTGDLKLHYVTPSGTQMAVPLQQFDMSATMKANSKDGIRFLAPASAQPAQAPGQR